MKVAAEQMMALNPACVDSRQEQVAASKIGTPGPKPLYTPKEANTDA